MTNVIPIAVGFSVSFILAGWWAIHMNKPTSKRATQLSVSGLFAAVLVDATRYTLPIDRGVTNLVLGAIVLVCAFPGLFCAIHYLGLGEQANPSLVLRGQKMIIAGILSVIYVGIGSRSVSNIATDVFQTNFFPQIWEFLAWAGLRASAILMGVGVLIMMRNRSLSLQDNMDEGKGSKGERLQALTFSITIIGIILSGFSISALGGLIVIVTGLFLYPVGWLTIKIHRTRASRQSRN